MPLGYKYFYEQFGSIPWQDVVDGGFLYPQDPDSVYNDSNDPYLFEDVSLVYETPKACLFEIEKESSFWFPKSQIRSYDTKTGVLEVPKWLADIKIKERDSLQEEQKRVEGQLRVEYEEAFPDEDPEDFQASFEDSDSFELSLAKDFKIVIRNETGVPFDWSKIQREHSVLFSFGIFWEHTRDEKMIRDSIRKLGFDRIVQGKGELGLVLLSLAKCPDLLAFLEMDSLESPLTITIQ